jgi:uncharacterized protein YuzE
MNRSAKMTYFEQEDVLHLVVSDEPEADSVEITSNITVELNEAGELIGVEILSASTNSLSSRNPYRSNWLRNSSCDSSELNSA